ncbi:fungal hydrophobin [Coprinellus micaceus]|uniref:Hydrophobin n=1 Tax=Coprinellus micaceus TaxID=71717 RepID=A0A4Y7TWI2_COPMI|nr:fungal hydrophobin [Coprinellus micaceus]
MFTRVVALATAATLFAFAAASPGGASHGGVSQCNAGKIQCCNSAQEADKVDKNTSSLLQTIGIDVKGLTGMIGSNCSPLSVAAIGGNSCTSQQVCCEGNHFNGLIAIGCTPINVSL